MAEPLTQIRLGSMLFTMVEPRKGHEVEYNRWYERDHFYAGCMIGAVPVRRAPVRSDASLQGPALSDRLADHARPADRFVPRDLLGARGSSRRVEPLGGRPGQQAARQRPHVRERDHIHTLLYNYDWHAGDPEGVGPALALDHPYAGMVAVIGDAAESVGRDGAAEWFRGEVLPDLFASTPVDQCISWIPQPLLGDAPSDVPRAESPTRFMHLYFLTERPDAVWDKTFANLGDRMRDAGDGRRRVRPPFIPTIPGTDTYTDQLW